AAAAGRRLGGAGLHPGLDAILRAELRLAGLAAGERGRGAPVLLARGLESVLAVPGILALGALRLGLEELRLVLRLLVAGGEGEDPGGAHQHQGDPLRALHPLVRMAARRGRVNGCRRYLVLMRGGGAGAGSPPPAGTHARTPRRWLLGLRRGERLPHEVL